MLEQITNPAPLPSQQKNKNSTLEPGLLRAFRWVNLFPVLIPLVSLTLISLKGNLLTNTPLRNMGLLLLGIEFVRLLYIFWPRVQTKLGKAFFPLACILMFAIPTLLPFLRLLRPSEAANSFLHLILILIYQLIVTVFVAWQYNMRVVAWILVVVLAFDCFYILAGTFSDLNSNQITGVIGLHLLAFLFISSIITFLVDNLRTQRDNLIKQNEKLVSQSRTLEQLSKTQERNRLARELHHTMVHYMSGTVLQLNGVKSQWSFNPEKAQSMLDISIDSLTEGLQETRKAIQALREHPTESISLHRSLKLLLNDFSERTGIVTQNRFENLQISSEKERIIYRITEEGLRNIERHASAKQVNVVLLGKQDKIHLIIKDDGCGFKIEEVNTTQSFGLQSMQEWAELVKGRFILKSEPSEGTILQVEIPLADD